MDDLQFLTHSEHQVDLAPSRRFWLVVACAEHVRRGQAGGFMQAGHGKAAPLRRLSPGDGVVCYSPSRSMGAKDGLQSFTAIGFIKPDAPYLAETGMFRRDVDWLEAVDQPIRPLLDWLDFTQTPNWGYVLRFGLIEISEIDFDFLQHVMTLPEALMADQTSPPCSLRMDSSHMLGRPVGLAKLHEKPPAGGGRRG